MELIEINEPLPLKDSISIDGDRIRATDNYEKPPTVLMIDGISKMTKGGISCFSGIAKSRKTTALTIAVADVITGNNTGAKFVPMDKGLAWADTEQSPFECYEVVKRLEALAGTEDGLFFYNLRRYGPKTRIDKIKKMLDEHSDDISLLVIDGVRDLVYDVNDAKECTEITSMLMAWTIDYDIHISLVLHANKGDGFMRGHLGTELENKSQLVFKVTQNEGAMRDLSTVSETFGRGRNIEDFEIKINKEGLPEVVGSNMIDLPSDDKAPWDN
ncbi:AAA family ATPase [Patiriisocius marinus]|uniref:AAA family ATPase n=1 Tax=Patiriisocius marinus TaxID=1397112 RepID=UPI00232AF57F|nr:AAA family ATPase [Patiriisocius marinus]